MAELSNVVASMADDDECMDKLSEHCGIDDLVEVRSAYRTAISVVGNRLVLLGEGPAASKSLLRATRMLERSDRRDPKAQFEGGHLVGDELLLEVFGADTDAAVDQLATEQEISASKARSVLEVGTAVFLSAATDSLDDRPTFGSLGAVLAADVGAPPGHGAATTPAAVAVAGSTAATATAASPDTAPSDLVTDGSGRAKWWLAAVPIVLLLVGGIVGLAVRGSGEGADGGADDDMAFTDDADIDSASDDSADGSPDGDAGGGDSSGGVAGTDSESAASTSTPADDGTSSSTIDDESATEDDEATDGAAARGPGGPGPNSPPIPPDAPPRHAVVSNNQFYLRGYISDPSEGEQIVSAMENVFGAGNVIDEYILDPELAAQFPIGETTVYIAETILFDTGSAVVSPEFTAILDFGVQTLRMQEAITLVVTGHTDSYGSDADNLALSQRRVDSVKQYFVDQGIAPERIEAIGMGESEPTGDNNTPEGRQANRRVEFLVENFTFGP